MNGEKNKEENMIEWIFDDEVTRLSFQIADSLI